MQSDAQVMQEHTNVDAVNVDAGKEMVAGRYIRRNGIREIEIYEYSSFSSLVAVLAHELGHALGLGHNNNPQSVMSPSSEQRDEDSSVSTSGTSISLSTDDISALRTQCRL